MKKTKNNQLWIAIIAAVIGAITTGIVDFVKKLPVLSTLKTVISFLYHSLLSFLTFGISVWVIISAIIILWLIKKLFKPKFEPPSYLDYKEDRLKAWLWKWDWNIDRYNKITVSNLRPYCPNCNTKLMYQDDWRASRANCPRCNLSFSNYNGFENIAEIESLIIDNIEKKQEGR
jgi:hypothetical protein